MKFFVWMMLVVLVGFINVAVARVGTPSKVVIRKALQPSDHERFQQQSQKIEADDEEEEEETGEEEAEIEDVAAPAAPCVEDAEHVGSGVGYVVKCGDTPTPMEDEAEEEEEEGDDEAEEGDETAEAF